MMVGWIKCTNYLPNKQYKELLKSKVKITRVCGIKKIYDTFS